MGVRRRVSPALGNLAIVLAFVEQRLFGVILLRLGQGSIREIHVIADPEKLGFLSDHREARTLGSYGVCRRCGTDTQPNVNKERPVGVDDWGEFAHRPLPDRRAPEALPPTPEVHHQVDDQGEPRIEVPPVKRQGQRQLRRGAAAPVHDPRHEHVHRDDEEHEVRDRQADPPFDEGPGPDDLGAQARQGPTSLEQVEDHQPDEDEADDAVVSDAHVQKLERAECGRGRAQQTEMDRETGSGAPRGPAVGGPLERRPGLVPEWRVTHRAGVHHPITYLVSYVADAYSAQVVLAQKQGVRWPSHGCSPSVTEPRTPHGSPHDGCGA